MPNEISKHSVSYDDEHDYTRERVDNNRSGAPRATLERYESARDAIFDAVLAGKLDDTDLKIIEARNCSPMPNAAEVGALIGISRQAAEKRVAKIKAMFTAIK
jgi:hypothetical protein